MSQNGQEIAAAGYYDHDQSALLGLADVPARSVLEIGCATGNLLRHFIDQGAERVTGVEYVASVAERARARCPEATILSGDVDAIPADQIGNGYDLMIASFVLEHVADPWTTLRRLKSFLRPGGQFVGALPNVRHWSVTVPLVLKGKWEYVDEGILDRTHYRFFSRTTIIELLESCGFEKIVISPAIADGKSKLANTLTLGTAKDHFAYAHRFSARVPS